VLISGANGYIGSHIAEQLIKHGYRVRGTVRNVASQQWLQEYFDKTHGTGKFEMIQVEDLSKAGAFDQAVKGEDF
jgi:nucleoside-diphosphate-sugar epimerase